MAIGSTQRYVINGLIDTTQPVLDNLTNMANSCGSWLTYSNELGKWGVVINKAETPVFNFNDSNILSTIEVTGVGLGNLYNAVRVEFPRRDIRGETDWVNIEIPEVDRHPNEIDNTLELSYDLVTDPVQAELLGFIELKQSRLNRTIKFATDWSSIGIVAGDVITVTNASYGFNLEKFRIISVTETTDDSGAITLDILAMGYSDSVYDEDFTLYERTTEDGIVTLGSIATPAQPQLTKFERDANPRILVEAVVPTGVVEKMEFWYSTDDVNYTIIATMLPTNGGVFSTGDEVEYSYSTNTSGNVYVKVRAVNNQTVSAFSPVGSLVYAPVQTTEAINSNTDVVDGDGNSLLGLLGANLLMKYLGSLMDGNTESGGLFEKIFDIFDDETGTDIRQVDTLLSDNVIASAEVNGQIVFYRQYYFDLISDGTLRDFDLATPWTVPSDGDYHIQVSVNWGGDAFGSTFGVVKASELVVGTLSDGILSTGAGFIISDDDLTNQFEDHYFEWGFGDLVKDDEHELTFRYLNDYSGVASVWLSVKITRLPTDMFINTIGE
jgi:hypothetical protein